MKNDTESRPFLEYSDDPVGSGEAGVVTHKPDKTKNAIRSSRLARDLVIFFVASLLWLVVLFFIVPAPSASISTATSSSPKHKGVAATATVQQSSGFDYRLHNVTSNAHWVTCGNSTAEARSSGCRYDPLLNHWVPRQCVDQEWIDEYEEDGSWAAFKDVNMTEQISPEEMGVQEHYYTSIRDHVNHCAMLWRKQFWTLFEARNVFDGVIVNTYHTEHCAEFLVDTMTRNRTEPTLVRVGFSGCWIQDADEL